MPSLVEVLDRSDDDDDGPCLLEVAAAVLRLEVDEGALRDAATPEDEEVSQGRAATAAADRDDVDEVATAGFEDDDDDDG